MPAASLWGLLAFGAGISLSFVFGSLAVAAVVVMVQAVLGHGWARLEVPAARSGAALAVVAALIADVALLAGEGDGAVVLLGVLGVGVVAALTLQLTRRDGRADVISSVAAAVTALFATCAGTAWIELSVRDLPWSVPGAVLLALAVVVGTLAAWASRGAPGARLLVAGTAGVLVGLLGSWVSDLGLLPALAITVGGALVAAATELVLVSVPNTLARTCLGSTVSVLLGGPLVLGVLRLAGG